MLFTKTIKRQGENIFRLEEEKEKLKEENRKLRFEYEYLKFRNNRIVKILEESNTNKEHYFETLRKIKKELISDHQSEN